MNDDYNNQTNNTPEQSILFDRLTKAKTMLQEQQRKHIESIMRPGENFDQAKKRWLLESNETTEQTSITEVLTNSNLRKAPIGDEQQDFFIPALYDVGTRDCRSVMDVLIVRLSKTQIRANDKIIYDLPDGYVQVSSGVDGMASIWDYDLVLMAISHLTEAMNRYWDGKGEKPGRTFRPHVSDVLKFTRRAPGGKQKESLENACKRLNTTHVEMRRTKKNKKGETHVETQGEPLIASYKIIRNLTKKTIEFLEIDIAKWMYEEIVNGKNPDVLTVHPDYFLIEEGIGRFIYRLARRAAGTTVAVWSFRILYERSGSTGEFKKFCFTLRKIIKANNLPDYFLEEKKGRNGPLLLMQNRSYTTIKVTVDDGDQDEG